MENSPNQKALWSELRRGSMILLVPEPAWLSLWRRANADSNEEPVWDEAGGAWLVSQQTAERLAMRAEAMESTRFARTVAHFEGELVSGILPAAALTDEAAQIARRDLVAFLERGSFSWRIVSL